MASILIVDDCQDHNEFIKDIIFRNKLPEINIFEANNGEDCLTLIEENPSIELVFLDLKMSDQFSGIDVLKKVQKQELDIKIIIITSHIKATIIDTCFSLGAVDFLLKPIDEEVLINSIREHLGT